MDVDFGDVDGDGGLDIVSADYSNKVIIWENDGAPWDGSWNSNTVGSQPNNAHEVEFVDLDNDGDLDLASGDSYYYVSNVYIWENDGSPWEGSWTRCIIGQIYRGIDGLEVGDLDHDGYMDIVTGDWKRGSLDEAYIYSWRNDGTPWDDTWTRNEVGQCIDSIEELKLADIDNDGDLDIASTDQNNDVYIWRNENPFSGTWDSQKVGTMGDNGNYVCFGDLDFDGDLDLVSIGKDRKIYLWENDGSPWDGSWIDYTPGSSSDGLGLAQIADLDNDGDLDIITGGNSKKLELWQNLLLHRNMPFDSGKKIGTTTNNINAVISADLDNDGDDDIISGDDNGALYLLENIRSSYDQHYAGNLTSGIMGLDKCDIDHDGDIDFVSVLENGNVYLWENPGPSLTFSTDWDSCHIFHGGANSALYNDVDRDGDDDLIVGLNNGTLCILENDGTPFDNEWAGHYIGQPTHSINTLDCFDLDQDGTPDIATGDANGRIIIWKNDGSPFSGEWQSNVAGSLSTAIKSLIIRDLDNDAKPDIIVGAQDGDINILKNDGSPFSGGWSSKPISTG
ncbi:MAG: VCBS repeat-containing protein, partial [Thermoplasmata archaeon]|nr:VCBS repeat-containing protein [Thermoplasmata archaeon]